MFVTVIKRHWLDANASWKLNSVSAKKIIKNESIKWRWKIASEKCCESEHIPESFTTSKEYFNNPIIQWGIFLMKYHWFFHDAIKSINKSLCMWISYCGSVKRIRLTKINYRFFVGDCSDNAEYADDKFGSHCHNANCDHSSYFESTKYAEPRRITGWHVGGSVLGWKCFTNSSTDRKYSIGTS